MTKAKPLTSIHYQLWILECNEAFWYCCLMLCKGLASLGWHWWRSQGPCTEYLLLGCASLTSSRMFMGIGDFLWNSTGRYECSYDQGATLTDSLRSIFAPGLLHWWYYQNTRQRGTWRILCLPCLRKVFSSCGILLNTVERYTEYN